MKGITIMTHLTSDHIDRAYIYTGQLSISTASCGCCSEYYDTDPIAHGPAFSIAQDELVKYIEREEERLEALKDYIADGGPLSKDNDQ